MIPFSLAAYAALAADVVADTLSASVAEATAEVSQESLSILELAMKGGWIIGMSAM